MDLGVHTLPDGGAFVIPTSSAKRTPITTFLLIAVVSAVVGAAIVVAIQRSSVTQLFAGATKVEGGRQGTAKRAVAARASPPGAGVQWTPIEALEEHDSA
jgi:hypothetical protein